MSGQSSWDLRAWDITLHMANALLVLQGNKLFSKTQVDNVHRIQALSTSCNQSATVIFFLLLLKKRKKEKRKKNKDKNDTEFSQQNYLSMIY